MSGYDFSGGTFAPSFRALESPIATACFGLVTFLPLRPLLSFPSFIAFISVSTLFEAAGEYFRVDDLFAWPFLAVAVVAILTLLVDPIREMVTVRE